jgi:hypothetical protein
MSPECPKCEASSTRRLPRARSMSHRFMYFFRLFPWECLTCQEKFFNGQRYAQSRRHPLGEVYTESNPKATVKAGSEESPSR